MKRYWIGLLAVAGLAVALAYALPPSTEKTVALIPAVVTHEPLTVGGGASIPVGPYFVRAHQHHRWCKQPVTVAKRGIHGVWRQVFKKCAMTIGPVKVYGVTPRATATRPVPQATSTPTSFPNSPATSIPAPPTPAAIATATPWWVNIPTVTPVPTSVPVPTVAPSNDPVSYELALMNATRATYGLSPYSLDSTQSNGTATCGGSIGHSRDMAASGTIWHVNAAYPDESFPNNFCGSGYRALGENVGMAGGYSINGALDIIHQSMMAEPHALGCQGNHACSIISQQYTRVGIGVYTANGSTWMTVDFEG